MRILPGNTGVLICLISASMAHAQEQKLPEPEAAALARAEAFVKRIYRADYGKAGADAAYRLAIKLINQAVQTSDDPAARFVLYRESAELAAKAGDFIGALSVIDELGQAFETDVAGLKVRMLKAVEAAPGGAKKILGEAALATVPDVLASSNPAAAQELIALAEAVADRLNNGDLKARSEDRRTEVKAVLREFEKYRAALAAVEKQPEDAGANLTVGKYTCFIKGDWEAGLPYPVKSGDPKLKALAAADLASPDVPRAQMEVADGWWDLGASVPAAAKRQVFGRAAYWYGEAVSNLEGLTQIRAQERFVAFHRQYPGLDGGAVFAPFAGLWEVRYTNTAVRRYVIDARGNLFTLLDNAPFRSRLVPSSGPMLLSFESDKLEKMVIKDGELIVQHFNPLTLLAATGVGKRKDLPEKKPGAAAGGNFRDISGIWLAAQSNKSYRIYLFGPKGTGLFTTEAAALAGRLTRKEDHILFQCDDNKICRIKPAAGGLRIDVFDPASTYPAGEPIAVSTAIRLSR